MSGARRETIARNLERCRREIAAAAARADRDPASVGLLAVTKYVSADVVRDLYELGLRDFGESRVQRGAALREELPDLAEARWHLVGHLQRNKVRQALRTFHVVHSLDSYRLAEALIAHAREAPLLDVYLEVNVGDESEKTGMPREELPRVLELLRDRGGALRICGLMAMGSRDATAERTRPEFRALHALRDRFAQEGLLPGSAGLSMGMSDDFPIAVEEGATIVRVGSLLFEGIDA